MYTCCVPVDMWLKESDCVSADTDGSKDKRSHKDSRTSLEQSSQKDIPDNISSSETYIDVLKSVRKHVAPSVCGLSPKNQKEVDKAMMSVLTPEGNQYQ